MGTGRYKSISLDEVQLESGYIGAWLSLLTDFNDIQIPVVTDTPEIGDIYTISNSHDWMTGKEPISLLVKQDSVEVDGESVGDINGGLIVFKPKFFLQGDGASVEEIINNIINEKFILFVSEMPWNGHFIQYGSVEIPCEIERLDVKSCDLINGGKGTAFSIVAFCKYFYKGIIPTLDSIFPIHILSDSGLEIESDDGQSMII